MRAGRGRRCLCASDDHHQEFVGADERDRWRRRHDGTDRAMAKAVGDVAASVATMLKPSSHRASVGMGTLRRAESSITIELA